MALTCVAHISVHMEGSQLKFGWSQVGWDCNTDQLIELIYSYFGSTFTYLEVEQARGV